MVSISSNLEVCEFSWRGEGAETSIRGGLHLTRDAHFRTRMSYSSQKSCVRIWFRLVEPFKNNHLNYPVGGGGGGRNPLLWGLHVTCDAHFRTWPSYFSQKSYVKIWFGLVEAFEELSHPQTFFQGGGGRGQKPLIRGVAFDL